MAELVDALISGVSGETRAGSTPVIRTMKKDAQASFFVFKVILSFQESVRQEDQKLQCSDEFHPPHRVLRIPHPGG